METDVARRTLFYFIGGLVLLAGLGWALWIYQAVEAEEQLALANAAEGGSFHQVVPGHSKKFLHDLELYGGKANVLMYRFQVWLEELFQGKSLAVMVACLALGAAGWFIYAARRPPGHGDEYEDEGGV